MSGDARDFNNFETRALIKFCYLARQDAEENSRYSDRNIRGIFNIVCHRQKLLRPVKTWLFFYLFCASSWTTQNSDHSGDYW